MKRAVSPPVSVSDELQELRAEVRRLERRIDALLPIQQDSPPAPLFNYFEFEQRFRGTMADITARQARYLDLFRDRRDVIDAGSGRGEFLDLMEEIGVSARGVDLNDDMVRFARERGHEVERADAFEYFEGLPAGSIDGVFAAQLVEHLPPERIFALLRLWYRALGAGGVAVAETINTRCPEAMMWFYLDPTHVRPVPPEMLSFACEQAGFDVQSVRFSSPLPGRDLAPMLEATGDWPAEVSQYQDYAVVVMR